MELDEVGLCALCVESVSAFVRACRWLTLSLSFSISIIVCEHVTVEKQLQTNDGKVNEQREKETIIMIMC